MQIVIVGAGHAAAQCVLNLKREGINATITLIGDEPYLPYMRPPLSKAFLQSKQTVEQLFIKPQSYYDDNDVQFIQAKVEGIDKQKQSVMLDDGRTVEYTKVVIATGARLRHLTLPGSDLENIFYLKTIADAEAIKTKLASAKRLLVCGGGYIGLEVAASAKQVGLDVKVVEMGERIMQRVVSSHTSEHFSSLHKEQGVDIICNKVVNRFIGDKSVQGVSCEDGSEYEADLVIVGIGVSAETGLAEKAGLTIDNGIVVNEYCQSSDANIYAIGDCAVHYNNIYAKNLRLECVQNANGQAKTTATHIAGKTLPYNEVPWFWSDQYDQKLQIAGLLQGYDELIIRGEPNSANGYSVLALKNKKLIAVEAVKRPKDFMQGKALITEQVELDSRALKDSANELNAGRLL